MSTSGDHRDFETELTLKGYRPGASMSAMNRLALWTTLVLLGVAVAGVDLFTGWTVGAGGGVAAIVVVVGLLVGAIALFVTMLVSVIRDRSRIPAQAPDDRSVLARASRGLRWSSLFAIGFCLVLFANCSGGFGMSGPVATQAPGPPVFSPAHVVLVSGALYDPSRFWVLTAWVLAPLLLALLIPPALTTAAERLASGRPRAARRLGRLAIWSTVLVGAAVLLTVVIGLFVGVNSCLVMPADVSQGYCAAGIGSITNLLSLGALALFLPYLSLVMRALAHLDAAASRQPDSGAGADSQP